MLLCAITDRRLRGGDEASLVDRARAWAWGGVDFIQIREKDLGSAELLALARRMVAAVRAEQPAARGTKILLNGAAEIALAAGCDGVHLPAGASAADVAAARVVFARAGREAVVSVACHSVEDVAAARGASLMLFAPVFEKRLGGAAATVGQGLTALTAACRAAGDIPVLALGGVTAENARACVEAGAAGIAAIRLFLGNDWRKLRAAGL